LVAILVVACGKPASPPTASVPAAADSGPDVQGHTAPTSFTVAANAKAVADLPLDDPQDYEDARRGLIASDPAIELEGAGGARVWSTKDYAFVEGDAPASVNPSLWRQAKLNGIHGLFKVADGIHQIRGYDISNMTIIDGRTGWIVVDPLTARETAAAGFALARTHLGQRPVVAVIFTHSHGDHFGGIDAIMPAVKDPAALRVIAPSRFVEESTSENVLAGIAMGRRATYMYGWKLARSPRGHVDTGLGKSPATGEIGFREPTDLVDRTPQEMTIDGVRFVFQYAPESEAPAELTFYLPEHRAFCGAEIVSHTMHNLYTLRGAKVRDALKWSGYINQAIDLFGDAEVVFASHSWPVWGNERVIDYLEKQRDTYRYIHDQTLRLANSGYTPNEIAEMVDLPPSLQPAFANRGYYGTVSHNVKAVYQFYFGWYDANPAHLNPLPPTEEGAKYVAAMGGAQNVLEQGRAAYDAGEYRWAATLLNHLVFATPEHAEAKALLAATYDQLGYRAESGPWRDVYLTGAYELRHGAQGSALKIESAANMLRHTPLDRFFASMAARLNGPEADGKDTRINFIFTDAGESYVAWIENSVLQYRRADPDPNADATIKLTRDFLIRSATGQAGIRDMIFSNDLDVDGSRLALLSFFSLLDRPNGNFPIVTP
ncbi:MAG TPA: alkyl sulfatase dimerization domain-containing protein, partial [Candidatus Binatia bacterium]|nr:alkyl sulfatase dimerization domain-containing protein [Candidatus Binatia bacterium]